MYQNAAILAAFLLIYSAVAGRIERSWISGPIVRLLRPVRVGHAAHEHQWRGVTRSGRTDPCHGSFHRCRQRGFQRRQAQPWAPGAAAADRPALDDRARFPHRCDRVPLTGNPGDSFAGGDAGADRCGAGEASRDEPRGAGGYARGTQSRERPKRRHLCADRGAPARAGGHPDRRRDHGACRSGGSGRDRYRADRRPRADLVDHLDAGFAEGHGCISEHWVEIPIVALAAACFAAAQRRAAVASSRALSAGSC